MVLLQSLGYLWVDQWFIAHATLFLNQYTIDQPHFQVNIPSIESMVYCAYLPNLVKTSWLRRISPGLRANQKLRWNILVINKKNYADLRVCYPVPPSYICVILHIMLSLLVANHNVSSGFFPSSEITFKGSYLVTSWHINSSSLNNAASKGQSLHLILQLSTITISDQYITWLWATSSNLIFHGLVSEAAGKCLCLSEQHISV